MPIFKNQVAVKIKPGPEDKSLSLPLSLLFTFTSLARRLKSDPHTRKQQTCRRRRRLQHFNKHSPRKPHVSTQPVILELSDWSDVSPSWFLTVQVFDHFLLKIVN